MRKTWVKIGRRVLAAVLAAAMVVATDSGGWLSGDGLVTKRAEAADDVVTLTDESQLGTYNANLAYKRVGVHDPSVIQDPKTKRYYIFGSHCAWAWSDDLENWTSFTNNVTEQSAVTIFKDEIAWCKKADANYTVNGNMWAPDIVWNEDLGKWCMYMTINGPRWNSTISLLTADSLSGNWTYVGPVIQSGMSNGFGPTFDYQKVTGGTDVSRFTSSLSGGGNPTIEAHAIDACVIYDDAGDLWMTYGSWSGGISMIKLDKKTGLRDYSTKYTNTNNAAGSDGLISDPYTGYKIAGGGAVSGEGSYLQKIGNYYYMFLSYGPFAPTGGYNMRIFRSKDIRGPYKDVLGKDARQVLNNKAGDTKGTTGMRLISYYKWSFAPYGYTAQGHNSAIVDDAGKAYVIYHNKFNDGTAAHEVRVHQLLTNEDGWILAHPFEYAGETASKTGYEQSAFTGDYSIMFQKHDANHDALECEEEKYIKLEAGTAASGGGYTGKISGAYTGTWTTKANSPYITLTMGNVTYKGVLCEGTVDETNAAAMTFTAVGSDQECLWGYRLKEPTVAIRMTFEKQINIPDTIANDIALPAFGVGGSKITWKSNSVAISDDGKVLHFKEDMTASLTATVSNTGYQYSKTYEFVVPGTDTLSKESEVAIKKFYTESELDLSKLTASTCPSFPNPFYYTQEDLSKGASISFDVTRTTTSDRLSNIISLNNKLGKLYFTGGSYLGFNDFNDHYFDANLNANYVAGTDYLSTSKVNIKLEFTSKGFSVKKDGKEVYSSSTLKSGTTPGGYSNNNPETFTLSWLKTAPELNFGKGNFWGDIFKGKIGNVICSYVQPAKSFGGGTSSSLTGIYTQDYENVTDVSTEWKLQDTRHSISIGASDGNGCFFLFPSTSTVSNNPSAYNLFGKDLTWPDKYMLEFDLGLKSGNVKDRSTSQFAIMSTSDIPTANAELSTDNCIFDLYSPVSTGTVNTEWQINRSSSETVTIPSADIGNGGWVHITLNGNKTDGTGSLEIKSNGTALYSKSITVPTGKTPTGFFVLNGRGSGITKVDNITVKEQGVDYVNRAEYDNILARAEQFAALQKQNAVFTQDSFKTLSDAITTAKSVVTSNMTSADQSKIDAQTTALTNAVNGLKRATYTVTVVSAENGTVTGLANNGKYYGGDSLLLTANPKSGYEFAGWKIADNIVSKNTSYAVMVKEDITITPVFEVSKVTSPSPSASVSSSPSGGVSASPNPSSGASVNPSASGLPNASDKPGVSNAPGTSSSPNTSVAPSTSNVPSASNKPGTSEKPTTKPTAKPNKNTVKKGSVYTIKGVKYKVTSVTSKKKTVTLTGVKNKSLKSLKIGSSVKIKNQTFKITALGSKALAKCKKLKTVTIGANVKSIGSQCFSGCSKLRKITIKTKVLTVVGKKAFKGIYKKAVIKVPKSKLKKYKKLMRKKGQPSKVKIK